MPTEVTHDDRADTVRSLYGVEAADLLAQGWTVEAAIDHVTGHCDVWFCTHPSHRTG